MTKNDELLDLVDESDNIIGTVWKSEAHGNIDLIHREVVACVFDKQSNVLIQQRSMNTGNPGVWRITMAGHIEAGEEPMMAAKRELLEELGIDVELKYFGKRFKRDKVYKESKFYWIYYGITDQKPLKLNPEEVMDAK